LEELLVCSLQTDALATFLIEKGLITSEEFMRELATYQKATESNAAMNTAN
jgi:hypothetical protein